MNSSFWDHSDRDRVIGEIRDPEGLPPPSGLGRLVEAPARHLCPLREDNCPLHKGALLGQKLRRGFLWRLGLHR